MAGRRSATRSFPHSKDRLGRTCGTAAPRSGARDVRAQLTARRVRHAERIYRKTHSRFGRKKEEARQCAALPGSDIRTEWDYRPPLLLVLELVLLLVSGWVAVELLVSVLLAPVVPVAPVELLLVSVLVEPLAVPLALTLPEADAPVVDVSDEAAGVVEVADVSDVLISELLRVVLLQPAMPRHSANAARTAVTFVL